jgi:uncharacterized protein
VPDELLDLAYVFSGLDRVLGLHGRLRVAGEELVLDDLLVACTHVARGETSAAARLVRRGLAECGWSAADGPDGPAWRSGAFQIRLDDRPCGDHHLHSVLLCLGEGPRHIPAYLERDLPRHVRALRAAPPSPRPPPPAHARQRLDEVAAFVARRQVIVYSGAGVSVESGIPAFAGAGSLDEHLGLHEPFPGEVLARMLACPASLADDLRRFQTRLATARPGIAHRLLASLERAGVVSLVVTTNIDMLHELAGSAAVLSPAQLRAAPATGATALLVLGVSRDDDGVIAWARGAGLRVIAADPEPPEYLGDGDWYVQADASTVLRAVAAQASSAREFPAYEGPSALARERRPMRATIPDLGALLADVHGRSTSLASSVHGDSHWRDTAWFGAEMVRVERACDPALVFLFALIHDCLRVDDGYDPEHGLRSAALVAELRADLLVLTDERAAVLRAACAEHSSGLVTAHPTIGACWDADRLGLWRIDVAPVPAGLSLAMNRAAERIERASREHGTPLDWASLFELYDGG